MSGTLRATAFARGDNTLASADERLDGDPVMPSLDAGAVDSTLLADIDDVEATSTAMDPQIPLEATDSTSDDQALVPGDSLAANVELPADSLAASTDTTAAAAADSLPKTDDNDDITDTAISSPRSSEDFYTLDPLGSGVIGYVEFSLLLDHCRRTHQETVNGGIRRCRP